MAANVKRSREKRDPAYDTTIAFNEFRRYYWHYPNSKEEFMSFAESYVTYFWNDLKEKERAIGTWYQFYKKIEKHQEDYQIYSISNVNVFTDYKERQTLLFESDICADSRLERMSISDFKRQYWPCALDSANHILWDSTDSLTRLYSKIQQLIIIAQTSSDVSENNNVRVILFKFRRHDESITFLCDLDDNDYIWYNAAKGNILNLLKGYCAINVGVSEINMYVFI